MTLFLGHMPWMVKLTEAGLDEAMRPYLGERTSAIVTAYRQAQPKATARQLAIAIVTDQGIRMPSLVIAERKLAQKAAPVFVYLFAWETPVLGGRLGSCHTLEIPFVFDNLETAALTGTDPARRPLSKTMRQAWVSFARTGTPMPGWPAYSTETRATMIFDTKGGVENDPRGAERRAWDN